MKTFDKEKIFNLLDEITTYDKEKLINWIDKEKEICEFQLKYTFEYCTRSYFQGVRKVLTDLQQKLEKGDFKSD